MNERRLQFALAVLLLLPLAAHGTGTELRIPSRPKEILALTATQDPATNEVVIDVSIAAPDPAIATVRIYENGNLVLETDKPLPLHIRRDPPLAGTYVYRAEAVNGDQGIRGSSNEVRVICNHQPASGKVTDGNGIAVGVAKAFDDRALVDMLNDTVTSLQQAQSTFINPANLIAGIGKFQGGESVATGVGLSISTLPTAAKDVTVERTLTKKAPTSSTTTNTGGADGDSTSVTDTGAVDESTETSTDKTTRSAVEPAKPETSDQLSGESPFAFEPGFGIAPADLLAQQTELAYEAANLRLLLQRAVSDRALIETTALATKVDHRLQVVLGFQVSIEPLARYRGGVAEAIITIRPKDARNRLADAPSLVALLPREKSYNVATIRKSAQAFSLGGIVQALNVGATVNRTRDTLYLVKDTDTVALERVPANDGAIEFAWQFRPVLDQRTVAPGTRQMFAVISLPAGTKDDWIGEVSVQTRWRKYNRRKKAVGEPYEDSTVTQAAYDLRVDSMERQALAVGPRIDAITWDEAGPGQVFVTVLGRFPLSTHVAAGDLIRSPGSGLIVDTNRRLTFTIPALKLFFGDIALVDRYGEAQSALYEEARNLDKDDGITEIYAQAKRVGVDKTELKVYIAPAVALDDHRPLFRIGNTVFGLSDNPVSYDYEKSAPRPSPAPSGYKRRKPSPNEYLVATLQAPRQLVAAVQTVQIVDPFWGDRFNRTVPVHWENQNATTASNVQLVAAGAASVTFSVSGEELAEPLKLYVGDNLVKDSEITVRTSSLLMLTVDRANLKGAKHLVIEPDDDQSPPIVLPLPLAELSQPQVLRHAAVREGDSGRIRLDGVDLLDVKTILFNNTELSFEPDKVRPGRAIYVKAEASLTATPGDKELSIVAKDGSVQTFAITVTPKSAPAKSASS